MMYGDDADDDRTVKALRGLGRWRAEKPTKSERKMTVAWAENRHC